MSNKGVGETGSEGSQTIKIILNAYLSKQAGFTSTTNNTEQSWKYFPLYGNPQKKFLP